MATNLAGMLTITEEAAGRGSIAWKSHGWTGASQERTTGAREGGYSISGYAALIIYHRGTLSKRRQPTIDYMHVGTNGHAQKTPVP